MQVLGDPALSMWTHYAHNPDNLQSFSKLMTEMSKHEIPIVVDGIKKHWGSLRGKVFVDVGGSEGAVSVAIKKADPAVRASGCHESLAHAFCITL